MHKRMGMVIVALGVCARGLAAQEAPRSSGSASGRHNYWGGGIAMMAVEDATLPMVEFRYAGRSGGLVLPDIAIAGLPPYFISGDVHLGAALPLGPGGSALIVGAGPSILMLLGGGAVVGFGGSAGLLLRVGPTVALRLDAGPRFFTDRSFGHDGAHAEWMFSFTILSTGEPRCACAGAGR